jgi:hypothetical protein
LAGGKLVGRAEGFAFAAGDSVPSPEYRLLAMIYGDHALVSLLAMLGAPQEKLLEGLREHGVNVPTVPPKIFRPWRGRHYLYVDGEELHAIINILSHQHPPGSEWQWGYGGVPGEPEVVRISAEEGIDLEDIAERARSSARL